MDGPNQQQQRFRLNVFFKHKHAEEQKYFCEAAVKPPALGMFRGRLERSVSAQERCRQQAGQEAPRETCPLRVQGESRRGVCIQTLAYDSAMVPVPAEGFWEVGQAGGRAPGSCLLLPVP